MLPVPAPAADSRGPDETVFVLPLRRPGDAGEIRGAVRRLAPRALLFLREINEIEWRVEDGASGLYLRETEELGGGVRRVTLVGEADGQRETERAWLVFARALDPEPKSGAAEGARRSVEVAFRLDGDGRLERTPESDTPLVAFFPTTLPTGLRFRIQGPFRTTLARDNVPAGDPWNEALVRSLAETLTGALRWLRDHRLLDAEALRCLPLGRDRFPEGSLLAPLREATVRALRSEPLLPRFGGGYVTGAAGRIASPKWLRELLGTDQLGMLLPDPAGAGWLGEEIRPGSADALSRALQDEVGVRTLRLDVVLRRLDAGFWSRRRTRGCGVSTRPSRSMGSEAPVKEIPLIRLRDGVHVAPGARDRPTAFLPGPAAAPASLPVVREAVVDSPAALQYLRSLGVTELDPVELVLRRIAPKYRSDPGDPRPGGLRAGHPGSRLGAPGGFGGGAPEAGARAAAARVRAHAGRARRPPAARAAGRRLLRDRAPARHLPRSAGPAVRG